MELYKTAIDIGDNTKEVLLGMLKELEHASSSVDASIVLNIVGGLLTYAISGGRTIAEMDINNKTEKEK